MKIFDSHTHLNDVPFRGKEEIYLDRARELGVVKSAVAGQDPEFNERAVDLSQRFDNLYAIVGYCPDVAKDYDQKSEDKLVEQLKKPKTVALGEIGLDYYYDFSDRETQKRVFIRQLELAREVELPIIIHDRDAHGDIMNILRNEGKDNWGIFHCYSGSWEMAKEAIKMGFYISFAGPVVFPKSTNLKEVAKQVPVDRILIETDSPYLTPPPFRGRRNDPSKTQFVAEEIASLKGLDVDEFCEIAFNNGKRVFGIE